MNIIAVLVRPLPICQIALSARDLDRTHAWYRGMLGFLAGGHLRRRGEPTPGGWPRPFDVWCLVDQRTFFQFEVFGFTHVTTRSSDWRPCDFGYSTIGVHIREFESTLEQLQRAGTPTLAAPIGAAGRRRVCVQDPDGVLVELMEEQLLHPDPGSVARADVPAFTQSITLSVPDLDDALSFWRGVLGLAPVPLVLHEDEHESMWGLSGAHRTAVVLDAGSIFLELVQYREPVGRAHPGARLTDQGILNVALGTTTRADFEELLERLALRGLEPLSPPLEIPDVATSIYFTDPQGFSVEVLWVDPAGLDYMGFTARR